MRSTKKTATIPNRNFFSDPLKVAFLVFLSVLVLVTLMAWFRADQGPLENTACLRIAGHYVQMLQEGAQPLSVSPQRMTQVKALPHREEPNNELYGDEGLVILQDRFDRESARILPHFHQACLETQERIHRECGFPSKATASHYGQLLWAYWQQSVGKDLEGLKSEDLLQFGRTRETGLCGAF